MAFFDAPTFNPQSYGGQGGGLLDLLRSLQMQQQYQPSAGFPQEQPPASFADRFNALPNAPQPFSPSGRSFDSAQFDPRTFAPNQAQPIAVGDYSMPRIGSASLYEPNPAVLPPNAQMTQGQLPPQGTLPAAQPTAQPAQPDFGNRLSAGLEGFAAGPGMISKLTGLAQGLSTGQSPTNMTQQALVRGGLDPAIAQQVVRNPELLRAVLPTLMGTAGQTDDIKEYQFAKKEDPSLTFQKFMQQKKAVSGEYSLTPQYGTNDKGETVLLQTGKSGEAIQTKLPPGVKVSSGVDKIDLGTTWGIVDKRTGQMIGTQPKDVSGKEAAEKRGQAQGTAQAALANGADIDAEETKKKIDQFISHKGFNEVFGQLDQFRPSWTHSNEGADALARYKQLKGVTFLTAYQMLKGGGAITDIEGQKAGDAMARLDRAQSEDEAKQALRDFREAVDIGLQKLKRAAGGGSVPAAGSQPKTAAPDPLGIR